MKIWGNVCPRFLSQHYFLKPQKIAILLFNVLFDLFRGIKMHNKLSSLFTISTILMCLFSSLAHATDTESNSKTSKAITVNIAIDENLVPNNANDWSLYVYAALPNTRTPLSFHKTTLDKLPLEITLDESMFLLPTHTIKDVNEVVVVAKASKSEDAHKKSDADLIGISKNISFKNQLNNQ